MISWLGRVWLTPRGQGVPVSPAKATHPWAWTMRGRGWPTSLWFPSGFRRIESVAETGGTARPRHHLPRVREATRHAQSAKALNESDPAPSRLDGPGP